MVTSVSCFCRPPALCECLGRGGSPCAGWQWPSRSGSSRAHTAQREQRGDRGTWGQRERPQRGLQGWLGVSHTWAGAWGSGTDLHRGRGCASPTRATSLFGDREGGREGEEGVSTAPPMSLWLCCPPRPGASVPQFICLHMPTVSSPQKPKVSWEA